jgi:hypothetical protein
MSRLHWSISPLIVAAVVAVVVVASPVLAERQEDLGIELTSSARRLEAHRYASGRDWEATVKHFRDRFKGNKNVRFSREVSVPTVKYVHIENLVDTGAWQGINIYQMRNGEVRISVLPRESSSSSSTKSSSSPPVNSAR